MKIKIDKRYQDIEQKIEQLYGKQAVDQNGELHVLTTSEQQDIKDWLAEGKTVDEILKLLS